jgi:hypothetical protein
MQSISRLYKLSNVKHELWWRRLKSGSLFYYDVLAQEDVPLREALWATT